MDGIPPNLSAADQRMAEILEHAAGTGDLTTVTTILSQLPIQPRSECFHVPHGPECSDRAHQQDLWPFTLVINKAIEEKKVQVVSYVLSCGLKPGLSITIKALESESVDIFQALLDHGWDINAPLAPHMSPPLCYAIKNEPLVHWFLSHGASPDASAPQNARTPFHSACAAASLSIVKVLHARGASHLGALHSAAESPGVGRLEVMQFLLDNGANVDAVRWEHNKGMYTSWSLFGLGTALHYAAQSGHVDRVELLLSRGAKIDALDSIRRTPLDVAQEYRKTGVVAFLTTQLASC